MLNFFLKSEHGISNKTSKEKLLHTLESMEIGTNGLKMGAKVRTKTKARPQIQKEAAVARANLFLHYLFVFYLTIRFTVEQFLHLTYSTG